MSIYQLVDPFTLFYFKFIKKNGKTDNAVRHVTIVSLYAVSQLKY